MLKFAGRLPLHKSALCARKDGYQLPLSRTLSQQGAAPVPPPSQKYDANSTYTSEPQQSPGNQNKSRGVASKILGGAAVGVVVVGGFLALDPLGIMTEKKPLSPVPNLQTKHNVADARKKDTESIKSSSSSKVSPTVPEKPLLKSQPSAENQPTKTPAAVEKARDSVLASIVEDSVQLLVTGKRSSEDEDVLNRLEQDRLDGLRKLKESRLAKELADQKALETKIQAAKEFEENKLAKNAEFERILSRKFSEVLENTKKAVVLNSKAADVSNEYNVELKKAMDADIDCIAQEHWSRVCELRQTSLEQSSYAREVTQAADKLLLDILNIIEKAKGDDLTSGHPSIPSFEKQAKEISDELHHSIARLVNVDKLTDVMKEYYKNLQEQEILFQQELQGKFPQSRLDQKGGDKLSPTQLAALVEHAHRQVLLLKQQLRDQQLFEKHRLQESLGEQRMADDSEYRKRLEEKLSEQAEQCKVARDDQLKSKAVELNEEMESEMTRTRLALKKHEIDMLRLQEKQMADEHESSARRIIEKEMSEYKESVAHSLSRVDQLLAHVVDKGDADVIFERLQQLTQSAHRLKYTLANDDPVASTPFQTVDIKEAVDMCRQACPTDTFIQALLDSIPERVLSSGLYTHSSLEKRFEIVFNECRKSAFLPDSSNIFSAWLSRAYGSMTHFGEKPKYTTSSEFYQSGTEGMSTKDLLIQARYFIDRRSMIEAVRCMLQLKGVPRTLAQDWINEARQYLEVEQTCQAIYAYAMALAMGQIL